MATAKRLRLPTYLTFDEDDFPYLNNNNHRVSSQKRDTQNCIAYAAGDDIHSWWPLPPAVFPGRYPPRYYWPSGCPKEETLAAFECAFSKVGFSPCTDGKREAGYVKIAIFGSGTPGDPKAIVLHAARQSPFRNDQWRSKMGDDYDIDHQIAAVEGPLYGVVLRFMKKPDV
jgi:hypothetical protein